MAEPWWWAQFSKGNNSGVSANQLAKWVGFFINSASDTTYGGAGDTVYLTSFTWGSVNTAHTPVTGILNAGDIGINQVYTRRATAGDRLVRIIGDADQATWPPTGVNGSIGQSGESGVGSTHNKVVYVASQGLMTGSANVTDNGGYSAQPNDVFLIKAWAAAGVLADYLDDLTAMFGGTFGDGTSNNSNFVFNTTYGDTIEVYFTDDNGNIPGTLAKNADGTDGTDIGDVWTRLTLDATESVFYVFNIPGLPTGAGFGGNYADALQAFTGTIAGAGQSSNQLNSMHTNLSGDHTCRDGDDYYTGEMHHKLQIFDMDIVATGSANTTSTATRFNSNEENIIVIHNPGVARRYMAEWHRVMGHLNSNSGGGGDIYETTAPNAPTNLTVAPSATDFSLSWTAPSDPGDFSRYYVFISDTFIIDNSDIGDGLDDDSDGYFDEDPVGDWDGFKSGVNVAGQTANDDDADGSIDEDPWLSPEAVLRGSTPTAADTSVIISSWNIHDSLTIGTSYWFAVVAVDKLGNESTVDTAGPFQLDNSNSLSVVNWSTIASDTVYRNDTTVTVQHIRITGDAAGDTLTDFAVANEGSMGTADIDMIRLWEDNGDSTWSSGDTLVAGLTWNAGKNQWDTSSLSYGFGASSATFLITIDVNAGATWGDTFLARIPAYELDCSTADSGPTAALLSGGTFTVVPQNLSIYNAPPTLSDSDVVPGSQDALAQFIQLTGDNEGDILTDFSVSNLGTTDTYDIDQVQLWQDNGDSDWSSADTLVAGLTWNAGTGVYDTTGLSYWMGQSSATFLITVDFSLGAGIGETFRAQVDTYGSDVVLGDSGPTVSVVSTRTLTVIDTTLSTICISEILADPPSSLDVNGDGAYSTSTDEFIEIYNYGTIAMDITGWSLSDDDGGTFSFPASTILAPGEYATLFPSAASTAGFTVGGQVFANATGSLALTNSGETIFLESNAGTLMDSHTWGAEGGNNESLVRFPELTGLGGFTGHTSADTTDASAYSPNTSINAAGYLTAGVVGNGFATQGDTNTVLLIFNLYGDGVAGSGGDTLINFAVRNKGIANGETDVLNLRLYHDYDNDSAYNPYADTYIAGLTWDGNQWETFGLTYNIGDSLVKFLLVADIGDSAAANDTIQLQVTPYGTDFLVAGTGPVNPSDSNAGVLTLKAPSAMLSVTQTADLYYAGLYADDNNVECFAFNVANSDAVPDTIITFTFADLLQIDTTTIDRMVLWIDNDTAGSYDGAETFVSTLTWDYNNIWDTWCSFSLPASGYNFLVTVDISSNPTMGDTLQLQAPAGGIGSEGADSGPSATITNTKFQYVSEHTVVISEVEYDYPGPDDGGEYIELYNPTSSPVSLDGWYLAYNSSADNPWTPDDPDQIKATFGAADSVPAHGFYLIGGDSVLTDFGVAANYYNNSMTLATTCYLYLLNDSCVIVDMLGNNGSAFPDGAMAAPAAGTGDTTVVVRKAYDTSTTTTMQSSDSTAGNLLDRDINGLDWITAGAMPKNSFSETEPKDWSITAATNLAAVKRGEVADTTVILGQTYVVAMTMLLTGDPAGDTLTDFTLKYYGNADTGVTTAQLWKDNNSDSQYDSGDTLVAYLTQSGDTWYVNGIPVADSSALGAAGSAFYITIDINPSGNAGETFQAEVAAYGSDAASYDSGPVSAVTNSGIITLASFIPNTLVVDTALTVPSSSQAQGATNVLVLAVDITGNPIGDTLTDFSVRNLGSMAYGSDVTAVNLWYDANSDSAYDAGDSLVAALINSGDTYYATNIIAADSAALTGGFLVTIDIAGGATGGSTFQGEIVAYGSDAASYDSGPATTVTNSGIITVSMPAYFTVGISEVLADPPSGNDVNGDGTASTASDEFIEVYNYGANAVDVSGWGLMDNGTSSCSFPAGTVIPPYGYATFFCNDADTTGYTIPGLVFAQSTFSLTNTGETVWLISDTGTVMDSFPYTTMDNQSWVKDFEADVWQGHETVDTTDASPYSPNTQVSAAGHALAGAVGTNFIDRGDSDAVLLVFTLYGDGVAGSGGDTLLNFAVENEGGADGETDILNLRLVIDNNADSVYNVFADSYVGGLTWNGTYWDTSSWSYGIADSTVKFLLVGYIGDSATVGDTVRLRVKPYSTNFLYADTGPANPAGYNDGVLTIKAPSAILDVQLNTGIYYRALYPSDANTALLAVTVTNTWGLADTLTLFRVENTRGIDTDSILAMTLWEENDTAGVYDGTETFVSTLTFDGSSTWDTWLSHAIPAGGRDFLVTAAIAGSPVMGDSIQLQVPIEGIGSENADSGPGISAIDNSMYQFVSEHTVLLSEIESNYPGGDANGEYVELYNPTGSDVSLDGWVLLRNSSADNPFTQSADATLASFGASDSVPAYGFYLVGGDSVFLDYGVVANSYNSNMGMADNCILTLRNETWVIVDLVGCNGAAHAEGNMPAPAAGSDSRVIERKAFDTSTTTTMSAGGGVDTIAGNAYDSDYNGNDWVLSYANPQNAFSETEPRSWPVLTNLEVALERDIPSSLAIRGDNNVVVMALRITGAPAGDTLTTFTLRQLGYAAAGTDITAVKLWSDNNGDSLWDSGDSLVAVLINSVDTWYAASIVADESSALGGAGSGFLVTIDIAGAATPGETFQGQVAAYQSDAATYDSGPNGNVTNTGIFTISIPVYYSVGLSEVLADPPSGHDINGDGTASTASDEFIELYNYGSNPVDISGWGLKDDSNNSCTFPVGSILPPGSYATMFHNDADVTGYNVPGLFAAGGSSFSLSNSGETVWLYTDTGVLVDTFSYLDGDDNQSWAKDFAMDSWYLHELIDTTDASPYSPGTRFIAAGYQIDGCVASGFATQGDSQTVMLVFNLYGYGQAGGDTLTGFAVENEGQGNGETDVLNLRIYHDYDNDSAYNEFADTYVAGLTWNGTDWDTSGLNYNIADSYVKFLLVGNIGDSASAGDTIKLRIKPYSAAFTIAGTGPVNTAVYNDGVLTLRTNSPLLDVTRPTDIYYRGLYASDNDVAALSLKVQNNNAVADTLTYFSVENTLSIDTSSIAAMTLWEESDTSGTYDGSETFVSTLTFDGGSLWDTWLSWQIPSAGREFLVTVDITATPVLGDTLQLQVPTEGIGSEGADSGPMVGVVGNSMHQYVSEHSVVLSEIETNYPDLDAGGEYIELYNPTASPVSLDGWSLIYNNSPDNPFVQGADNVLASFGAADSVPAYGFFLIGGDSVWADYGVVANSYNNNMAIADNCHITLRNETWVIIDLVGNSGANAAEGNMPAPAAGTDSRVIERKAFDTSTAATMTPSGGSDTLAGNAYDSDYNGNDWVLSYANPQNAFSETEPRGWPPSTTLNIWSRGFVASSDVYQSDTNIVVITLLIQGDPGGDTLADFTIRTLGNAAFPADITAAKLWRDNNADSAWDSGDSLVAVLSYAVDTFYAVGIVPADSSALDADGCEFLVTIDIAAAAGSGDTFQGQIPAYLSQGTVYDSGPGTTVTGSGIFTIQQNWPVADHLLLWEVCYNAIVEGGDEFIEIYNPTATPIDLSDYYISDNPWNYYKVVDNTQGTPSGDFTVTFPAGSEIGAYDTMVVCFNSDDFIAQYPGVLPDFEITQDGTSDGVLDMGDSGISGSAGLTNGGEAVILFYWAGENDLVTDVDICAWGNISNLPNKTGIAIDSLTDTDGATSMFAADDTSVASVASSAAGQGISIERSSWLENGEIASGGNGLTSHDETSESLSITWSVSSQSTPYHANIIAYQVTTTPLTYAKPGDTDVEALHFFLAGARLTADALTQLVLNNIGNMDDTDVAAAKLYEDSNGDGLVDGGDNWVATLAWNGSGWDTTAANITLGAGGETYVLAIDVSDSASDYDTFQATLPAYTLYANASESAPFVAITNANEIIIASSSLTLAYVPDTPTYTAIRPGDTAAVVGVVYLYTNLGDADTLVNFTVENLGSISNPEVTTLTLWENAGDSTYVLGEDTFVSTLSWNGSGWDTFGLSYPIRSTSGSMFLLTIDPSAAAAHNDTFLLRIPANGVGFATADTGPQFADVTQYPVVLVDSSPLVISEIYYDVAFNQGEEFIEITAVQAIDPSGWRIVDWDATGMDYTIPDSTPTLQPGDLLIIRMDTGLQDIDRTDGDVVFYLHRTNILPTSGDPISLIDTNPATFREFVPIESANDGDLFYNSPYVFCGWPNDGGGVTQQIVAASTGQSIVLPGANDYDNTTGWTTSDTPTEGRVSLSKQGDLDATTAASGETKAVMVLDITGASYADSRARLDRLQVTNLGTATFDDLGYVQLYRDDGDSTYGAGDTLVADLSWDGAGWSNNAIGLTGLNSAGPFIITATFNDTASALETFQANIPAFGAASAYTDSGPIVALANANALTAQTTSNLQAETLADVPSGIANRNDTNVRVMVVLLTGSLLGDSLTDFTIQNLGRAEYDTDITAVKLWSDNNSDSDWDVGDSLVAVLANDGGETWYASNIVAGESSVLAPSGSGFVITIDIGGSGAGSGETFQAAIVAYGCDATSISSGPVSTVTNPGAIAIAAADTSGPNEWYVSTAGDTSNDGLSWENAKRYIGNIAPGSMNLAKLDLLTQNDTINVGPGTFGETVTIDTDYAAIIGQDSVSSVINPFDSSANMAYGIYAESQTGLIIRDIGITNCYNGIYFRDVDSSRIENVSSTYNSSEGIYLRLGSDTNTLTGSDFSRNDGSGISLTYAKNNTLSGNRVSYNALGGIILAYADNNTVAGNTSHNNWGAAFILNGGSSNNAVTGNVSTSDYTGFSLQTAYGNSLIGNVVATSTGYGFQLQSSDNNTLVRNSVSNSNYDGFYFKQSNNNVISDNTSDSNGRHAFYLALSSADTFSRNNFSVGEINPDSGVWSQQADTVFAFTRNFWGTTSEDSISSYVHGTGADSILWYPYRLGRVDTTAGADTIAPDSPTILSVDTYTIGQITLVWSEVTQNEDGSALGDFSTYRVYRSTVADSDWKQNAFLMDTGSLATDTTITDTTVTPGVTYYYRVTAVDNHSPWENESWFSDTFTVTAYMLTNLQVETAITVPSAGRIQGETNVLAMVLNITGHPNGDTLQDFVVHDRSGAAFDTEISAVKLWSDNNSDSAWDVGDSLVSILTNYGDTWYAYSIVVDDSSVLSPYGSGFLVTVDIGDSATDGETFQAEIVAYSCDAATYDSGPVSTVTNPGILTISADTSGGNEWYVSTTGDTSNSGLSWANAKRYVSNIALGSIWRDGISLLTQGDTINIGAGTYGETFAIDTDYIGIIGQDSSTTIFNYGDSSSSAIKGIYADTQVGLAISDLHVTNSYYGIEWKNVDNSRIERVSATCNNQMNIYVRAGSDTNTVDGCYTYLGMYGIALNGNGNTITNSLADNHGLSGIYLDGAADNIVTNNTSRNHTAYGFWISLNSDNNTISGNTASGNGWDGFYLEIADYNVIADNTSSANGRRGFYLNSGSDNNRLVRNIAADNRGTNGYGFYLGGSSGNYFGQNTADSNAMYGFALTGNCTADTFNRNIFVPGELYPDSGAWTDIADTSFDFSRNYWSSTNEDSISGYMNGAGAGNIDWTAYRLGTIDTAAGADTVAPETTVITSADTSNVGRIHIVWTQVSQDEDGTTLDFTTYRIYRSASPFESDWKQNAFLMDTGTAASDTSFTDTTVTPGETYYYRVTAVDNHSPWENESFFSDTFMAVAYETPSYSISGTVPLEAGADDSGTYVYLYNSSGVNIDTYLTQTASGTFVFTGLASDTYYIIASNNHHLAQRTNNIVVSAADTNVGTTDELIAGDVNGDNMVNILDASYLKSVWGTADVTGDINRDGSVNESDMAFIRLHFGGIGE